MAYRLASDITWRCWNDGCVVFSASTAQTLLLSPEYAPALVAAAAPARPNGVGTEENGAVPEAGERLVESLVELGILEPAL